MPGPMGSVTRGFFGELQLQAESELEGQHGLEDASASKSPHLEAQT